MRLALAATLASIVAAGCSCGGDSSDLRVSGDRGYVRCLAAAAPEPRSWQVGALRLALAEERRLRIEGLPADARIAVFRGPVTEQAVGELGHPALAIVLGGVAASRREADASLAALAALDAPVLIVPGGDDRHDALGQAFEALDEPARKRLIDASPLRTVRIGAVELVPLAGAPGGRYALSNEACGLSDDDLGDVSDALGDPEDGVKRYLVSWAAPRGEGASSASRGLGGVEAGLAALATFAADIGVVGALFAWPVESPTPAEEDPLRVAVAPLSGAWVRLADGTRRPPGATVLILGEGGLRPGDDSP